MFTSALLATLAVAQTFEFNLLKDRRNGYDFVPYTPEQRVQVAQTMDNLFSIYVNRESKINYYRETPNIDAIPKVKKVLENAAQMTDRDLHYNLTEIVLSQRDAHLNYYNPVPHSCQLSVRFPRFTAIEDGGFLGLGKKEKIVVNRFIRFPEVAALTPDASKINIGDELLSVDGIPVQQFIKSKLPTWGGSNESGGLRGVLYRLSINDGRFHTAPTEDQVVYRMKSYNTGREYTVTIPWVVRSDVNCENTAKTITEQIKNGGVPESFVELPTPKLNKQLDASNPHYKIDQLAYGRVDETAKVTINPTADPIIRWAIYEPEKRNMGIIYMSSFVPANSDATRVTLLIRDLLLNQLKDTNSVIFDIRDNGGGIVTMADLIPQLGGSNIEPGNIRALVAPINRDIFLNSTYPNNDQFADAYRQVKPGDKYTPFTKFTSVETANSIGQAYLKPIGVFANGNCYSACDLFSATMQDNGVATVYGEDRFTGAGYIELMIVVPTSLESRTS
jgi:hypothetical protein